MEDAKKKNVEKKKKKKPKVLFRFFRKEGTVAEPWTSPEEMLEICKEAQRKIKVKVEG